MKKLFNFRPLVILGLSLVMGGYFWNYIFYSVSSCVIFLILALLIIVSVLYSLFYKKYNLFKKVVCLILLPFIVGASVVAITEESVYTQKFEDGDYYVSGEVGKIYTDINGDVDSIILEDVNIGKDISTLTKAKGNLLVRPNYVMGLEDIYIGDSIVIKGSLNFRYDTDSISSNVVGASSGSIGVFYQSGDFAITHGNGFKYNFSKYIKSTLDDNMDEESAGVAYAMIFGDRSSISTLQQDNFSASGLAHILAVSGLHVGFIATLLGFLIGLIIKNKHAKTAIMSLVLVFYCYLCSFSASVVRASVMYIIMMVASAGGEQYDGLSALGFSACVNFFINPLCIFTKGFMLSYTVVFAIFALGTPIKYLLSKVMPMKMASTLSVSLAAWVGSMPLLIYFFGEISFFSIVVNIVMVPFVGIVFMCMCLVLLVSWIPWANVLFVIPEFLYKVLNFVVDGVASLKYLLINLSGALCGIVFLVIAMILSSDYIFHKHKYLYSCLFVLCFFIALLVVGLI